MKCESCPSSKHNDPLTLIQQPSGYYLCPACDKSIKEKLSGVKKAIAPHPENAVIVDRNELIGLKTEGMISLRFYVYMALRIEGVTGSLKWVEVETFCKKWAIRSEDFIVATASLSKKGVVRMDVSRFKAQAVTHKERVQSMEVAYESTPRN